MKYLEYLHPIYRTLIIYVVLVVVMRVMGKREVGKLSPFDFVVAIVIAELAAIPIDDHKVSMLHGIIPILTLLIAEILISWIEMKSIRARKFINGTPSIVISKGKILETEMRQIRFSINDLLSQLREKGYANIADVEYAIIENTGHLSVIPKVAKRPVTPADLNLTPPYEGVPVALITDGQVLFENLKFAGIDRLRLKEMLIEHGVTDESEVFLANIDTTGNLYVVRKENLIKKKN